MKTPSDALTERPIHTDEQLQEVIDMISFDNSVVDFKWKFRFRPVTLPPTLDQNLNAETAGPTKGWLIWAEFERPDANSPHTVGIGRGRDEIVTVGQMLSGVAKTCWVLVEMLVKHELMEGFKVGGHRVFNPHHTIYDLAQTDLTWRERRGL